MVGQSFLDNKIPRPSPLQLRWCPACGPTEINLDALHVFVTCGAVSGAWLQLGIFTFLAECRTASLYFVFDSCICRVEGGA
jgi:hypothetical protein